MKELIIEYKTIDLVTKALSAQLSSDGANFDYVIGLSKGGLIPAVISAKILNAKVLAVGINSYNGRERGDLEIYQDIDLENINTDSKILVIDDICDSGSTMLYMRDKLSAYPNTVYISLYAKNASKNVVDEYGLLLDDDIWLVFPWEV